MNKKASGKIIAIILVVLLLVGGITTYFLLRDKKIVICEEGEEKCVETIFHLCESNEWIAKGEVEGKCGVEGEVPQITGDANRDGCVNVADLLIIRDNMGNEGDAISPPSADVNNDDIVNIADLLIIRDNLGEGCN